MAYESKDIGTSIRKHLSSPNYQAFIHNNGAGVLRYPSNPAGVIANMHGMKRMTDMIAGQYERAKKSTYNATRNIQSALLRYAPRSLETIASDGAIIYEDGTVSVQGPQDEVESNIKSAEAVESMYQRFLNSKIGRGLKRFLERRGYRELDLVGHGYKDMSHSGAIAAVDRDGSQSVFYASKDYFDKILKTALGILAMSHETVHRYIRGSENLEYASPEDVQREEYRADINVAEYFRELAGKSKTKMGRYIYNKLADVAEKRAYEGKLDPEDLDEIAQAELKKEYQAQGEPYDLHEGEDYEEKYDGSNENDENPPNMISFKRDYDRSGTIDDAVEQSESEMDEAA
ncbi:MAG: hypothetical protein V1740_00265 [Candidatus Woesearchaeota archaeon]